MRRLTAILGVCVLMLGAAACGDDTDTAQDDDTVPNDETLQNVDDLGDFVDLEPGSYFIDPDGDPSTPLRVTFEVAVEGWSSWVGAAKFDDDGHVGLSIVTVSNVVREACNDHRPADPAVGPTVDDLVAALGSLAPFEVTAQPSDVTILGYPGKHLELTVPDLPVTGDGDDRSFTGCTGGQLQSWIAPLLGDPFFGYNAEPGRTEEFWILEVDGTRLVLATTTSPASSPEDVGELRSIFDSIQIER